MHSHNASQQNALGVSNQGINQLNNPLIGQAYGNASSLLGSAGASPYGGAPDAFNSGNVIPTNSAAGGYGVPNSSAQSGAPGGGGNSGLPVNYAFSFAYT